jgi:AraC-like DNA-binding protein
MAKSKIPRRGAAALVNNPDVKARLAELGAVQYSLAEVAEDFGASETDVLDFFSKCRSASVAYEQSLADARKALRTAQFKLAEKSPTMAVFLGKHYLGQAERRELDASAQAAEVAEDAGFVRNALAALAAGRSASGAGRSGEDGAG